MEKCWNLREMHPGCPSASSDLQNMPAAPSGTVEWHWEAEVTRGNKRTQVRPHLKDARATVRKESRTEPCGNLGVMKSGK
jgi:hypothetical protein